MREKINGLLIGLKESMISLIPITIIISVLFGLQYTPIFPSDVVRPTDFGIFLICVLFLGIGTCLFTLGSESSMSKVGSLIGSSITKKRSILLIVTCALLLGTFITIAEPDLSVLSDLVGEHFNSWIFKIVVGVGVGVFISFGLLRIIFQKSIKLWIIFFHLVIFALACLFGSNGNAIFEISFDASGVTAGPISVPFLLTFGASIATVRGGKNSANDSFGVTGFCSIGPIIFVMILFLPLQNSSIFENIRNEIDVTPEFIEVLGSTCLESLIAIAPIAIFFTIYELIFIRIKMKELVQIYIGFIITYVGITIFLIAANIGLIPIGYSLGLGIMDGGYQYAYLFIMIGLVIGTCIVLVEPGIGVLSKQVEDVSGGAIKRKNIYIALAIAVSLAIVLALARAIWGNNFPIMYYYVPLYGLALLLALFVPDIYVAIGFDSGGVASGPMSSCFVLPLIIGIYASGNSSDGSGFGVLGLIQITPTILIEILGLIGLIKEKRLNRVIKTSLKELNDGQIIHF